ncbi:MAG: cupin domain-containing protein [Micrococcaceae bacterium]
MQTYFLRESELPVIMQVLKIPVGAGEGLHQHPRTEENLEEIYLVIKGTLKFTLNGEDHVLSPGDAALARPEDEHGMENIGSEALELMILFGRAAGGNGTYGHLKSIREAHAWRENNELQNQESSV